MYLSMKTQAAENAAGRYCRILVYTSTCFFLFLRITCNGVRLAVAERQTKATCNGSRNTTK